MQIQLEGAWIQLYKVLNGLAVHPFAPADGDSEQCALQIGDEIYCFEVFHASEVGNSGNWYRGYVVRNSVEVAVGIFPAAFVHVKEQAKEVLSSPLNFQKPFDSPELSQSARRMDPLQEEDEELFITNSNGFRSPSQVNKTTPKRPPRRTQLQASASSGDPYSPNGQSPIHSTPESVILRSPDGRRLSSHFSPKCGEQNVKRLPPRPTLTCGDETSSGQDEPLVDEIAAAMREWSTLMKNHLQQREYAQFGRVKRLLDLLYAGRRQLLSEQLSTGETNQLRRELVKLLATGNAIQGLASIVRDQDSGVILDCSGECPASPIELYRSHVKMAYSRDGTGDTHEANVTDAPSSKIDSHHIVFDLKAFVASPCEPQETCELYFSIFDKADMRFLTEDFCVILNSNGAPLDSTRLGKLTAIFCDLTENEIASDLFLVCRIVKNGHLRSLAVNGSTSSLALSPSVSRNSEFGFNSAGSSASMLKTASNGAESVRRPFGCAVYSLSAVLAEARNQQTLLGLDGPSTILNKHGELHMPIFVPVLEATFSTLHEDIILSRAKDFTKSPKANLITVSIKVARGVPNGEGSNLEHAASSKRLNFPEVFDAESPPRNDLYVKLWSAEFVSGGPSANFGSIRSIRGLQPGGNSNSAKNIEVKVEVRSKDGQTIPSCISRGSGEPSMSYFHSVVYRANSSPTYGELLKIDLAPATMKEAHLFLTFRDRAGKQKSLAQTQLERPFAFAFLPLFQSDNACVVDGAHTLTLNRYSIESAIPAVYLQDRSLLGNKSLLQPLRDTMVVRSFLCSSFLTQSPIILRVLGWEKTIIEDDIGLQDILGKLKYCSESDLLFSCQSILDALFGILSSKSNSGGEFDQSCFQAIVALLGTMTDRRFRTFGAALETYTQKTFRFTCYWPLLKNLEKLLNGHQSAESGQLLRATIKVLVSLFRFIVKARENQRLRSVGSDVTGDHVENAYLRGVQSVLAQINAVMLQTQPAAIIGTQVLILQQFSELLDVLLATFTPQDLLLIVETFCDNISHYEGKMASHKLSLLAELASCQLFQTAQNRAHAMPSLLRWLKPHLGRYEEDLGASNKSSQKSKMQWLECVRLANSTLAAFIQRRDAIHKDQDARSHEQDFVDYLLTFVPILVTTYHEVAGSNFADPQIVQRRHQDAPIPSVFPTTPPFKDAGSTGNFEVPSSTALLGELTCVILAIQHLGQGSPMHDQLVNLLDIEGPQNFTQILVAYFNSVDAMLDSRCIPQEWLNFTLFALNTTSATLRTIASILRDRYLPGPEQSYSFDFILWRSFFSILLRLVRNPTLSPEFTLPQRRRAVFKLASDLRGENAAILIKTWNRLGWPDSSIYYDKQINVGGFQVQLGPAIFTTVLPLCLSTHEALRGAAVQVFFTILAGEHRINRDFTKIHGQLIDALDKLFSEQQTDDFAWHAFISQLGSHLGSNMRNLQLKEKIMGLLESITTFLELLTNVRDLPSSDEGFLDDRIIGTLRLMKVLAFQNGLTNELIFVQYIKDISSSTVFCRYVHRLKDFHVQNQAYVEAGLVLKLHADLYNWDRAARTPALLGLSFPNQSEFHRKENLYLQIIDLLEAGKAYETALILLRELQEQYEVHTFAYGKLADILNRQATLYSRIVSEERHFPSFFRVAHYGAGFPYFVRDKEFVYCGIGQEKLSGFIQRICSRHPNATLIQTDADPSSLDVRNAQYLQISQVYPQPDRTFSIFAKANVHPRVRAYYEHNGTDVFAYEMAMFRTVPDFLDVSDLPADFLNRWTVRTTLTCSDAFPTVLKRSEVITRQTEELSPLDNAIKDVLRGASDLEMVRKQCTSEAEVVDVTALSAALNTHVDMTPDEGVACYRKAFFSREYTIAFPEHASQVQQLRSAIDHLAGVIALCLEIHSKECPTEMLEFHSMLCDFFHRSFNNEISRLQIDEKRFLPIQRPQDNNDRPFTPDIRSPNGLNLNGNSESNGGGRFSMQIMPDQLQSKTRNLAASSMSADSASFSSSQRQRRPASILTSRFGSLKWKRKENGA